MAFGYPIESISSQDAWIGAIAYMLQIYFDFSAYCDMAIGLAAMPRNSSTCVEGGLKE